MAIIFDLDGTLVDSTALHLTALEAAVKDVIGGRAAYKRFMRAIVRYPLNVAFGMMRKKYGPSIASYKNLMEIKRRKAEFFNNKNLKSLRTFPGVYKLPKLLNSLGIKFCIVTSISTEELKKFDAVLHIYKISKTIVNPTALRYEKPNPYTLNKAIRLMKADRKKTFYVGDSPYDALASKRAHIGFIGIHNAKELGKTGEYYSDIPPLVHEITRHPERFRD